MASTETHEQLEVRRRVIDHYFPRWCDANKMRDASAFEPDWSFLTPGLARWFLTAIDDRVAEIRDGCPTLPDRSGSWLFENNKPRLYREGFLEVAAVGMLASCFGWRAESLTFQSPPVPDTGRLWAFDLLTYTDEEDGGQIAIAGEAKWKQSDALKLLGSLRACGSRGPHSERDCTEPKNHHRKYQGLLDYGPQILWIIGPDAFTTTSDLVFRVNEGAGGVVQLDPVGATELVARQVKEV